MAQFLVTISLVIGLLAVCLSLGLLAFVYENCRFWKVHHKRLAPCEQSYRRTCLIVPCQGMEHRLRENLTAYLRQDHPNYEVVFVVESEQDAAVSLIRNLISENRCIRIRLLVAGRAESCGQKVHNLRVATASLEDDVEILVFGDSDIEPAANWMRWLVAGVGKPNLGARTGYRWMMPTKNNFPTLLIATINNSLATLLGRKSNRFLWGGGWAIHRRIFEEVGIREAWDGVLSDDLVASRALNKARLRIEFEPQCIGTSRVDYSTSQLIAWVHRQMLTTRCYAPLQVGLLMGGLVLLQVGFWASIVAGAWAIANGAMIGLWLLGNAGCLYLLGCGRALLRVDIARRKFPLWRSFRKARRFDLFAHVVAGWALLALTALTRFGKVVKWRRVRYRLSATGGVAIVARKLSPGVWPVKQSHDVDDVSNSDVAVAEPIENSSQILAVFQSEGSLRDQLEPSTSLSDAPSAAHLFPIGDVQSQQYVGEVSADDVFEPQRKAA